ncbi:hypothetical protein KUV85_14615 [Nocardioides panacisoli]|uniref:hypothetical protein n=1 Tax=Nocardioides panacisoli TaxID=627624 RepID=UPI001C62790F|nr:hypothetical protein [Nocardioides panacisoli]QYJ03549.1 hypothetical protein KUV85_14615 [Nocardioides panacisoli]
MNLAMSIANARAVGAECDASGSRLLRDIRQSGVRSWVAIAIHGSWTEAAELSAAHVELSTGDVS